MEPSNTVIDLTISSSDDNDNHHLDRHDSGNTTQNAGQKRILNENNHCFSSSNKKKCKVPSYTVNDCVLDGSNKNMPQSITTQTTPSIPDDDNQLNQRKSKNGTTEKVTLPNDSLPIDLTISPNATTKSRSSSTQNTTKMCVTTIYKGDGDNATVSTDILPLLSKVPPSHVSTCLGPHWPLPKAGSDLLLHSCSDDNDPFPLLYVTQNDTWSCGFRNLQMVLSSLLPHLPSYHRLRAQFDTVKNNNTSLVETDTTTNLLYVPSVLQLQGYMEESWKEGFDPKGAKHFHHKIQGRKSKIGAVEVSSLLAYTRIDSTVVQFVACWESRSQLGAFVWAYFNRTLGCRFCYRCRLLRRSSSSFSHTQTVIEVEDGVDYLPESSESSSGAANAVGSSSSVYSSVEYVHHLLSISPKECKKTPTECCEHPLLPLYLQWEGHSVTIVGIEKSSNSTNTTTSGQQQQQQHNNRDEVLYYQLLVFDPMERGNALKDKLLRSYGAVAGEESIGRARSKTECLSAMKLTTRSLLQKDCQVVLCTPKSVSEEEREVLKHNPKVVTAAWQEVETYVSMNGM